MAPTWLRVADSLPSSRLSNLLDKVDSPIQQGLLSEKTTQRFQHARARFDKVYRRDD